MGFKSRMIPSFEVFRADGHPCRGFTAKPISEEAVKTVAMTRTVKNISWYV
jgi:hypothetical protein